MPPQRALSRSRQPAPLQTVLLVQLLWMLLLSQQPWRNCGSQLQGPRQPATPRVPGTEWEGRKVVGGSAQKTAQRVRALWAKPQSTQTAAASHQQAQATPPLMPMLTLKQG